MISIRHTVTELERYEQERTAAVECYHQAILNLAHYTIEISPEITGPQRQYLKTLAGTVANATADVLAESQGTLRGLLRDYRDKAAGFLGQMRQELAATTRALEELMDSLAQSDGDNEARLKTNLVRLREVAGRPEAAAVRASLLATAGKLEEGLEEVRKQHQLALAQFQVEIRMLHQRIDSLEAASAIDSLTKLCGRTEMEEHIRSTEPGYCLLLARVSGLSLAKTRFNGDVARQLVAAFVRRLRNCLPPGTMLGRWGNEEFIALVNVPKIQAIKLTQSIGEQLSGPYACVKDGKTVRPAIQLSMAAVESAGSTPKHVLEQVGMFLTGD